eukprot:13199363-Alexandrium_andersonii.AAC.1
MDIDFGLDCVAGAEPHVAAQPTGDPVEAGRPPKRSRREPAAPLPPNSKKWCRGCGQSLALSCFGPEEALCRPCKH